MTVWQRFALGIGDALDGVLGGIWKAIMKCFGLDLDALRAEAVEEERQREAQAAVDKKAATERAEDLAIKEATLAALLDLRADLATPAPTSWEPPERGQVDGAVAAERRARHQAIKRASDVEVRACDFSDPEVDEQLRWRVA